MAEKKKQYLRFFDLITIGFSLFKVVPHFFLLIEAEARIAGKSLTSLFILHLMAGSLLTCMWFCFLAFLFVYFTSLSLSPLISLFILMLLNLFLLIIVSLAILNTKNKLTFPETRQMLRHLIHK